MILKKVKDFFSKAFESFVYGLNKKKHDLSIVVKKLENVTIEITRGCNLCCKHCYMSALTKSPKDELKKAEIINFVKDVLSKFGKQVSFAFTGGEPFARKDFLEILDYFHENKIIYTITTNGLILDDKKLKAIKPYCKNMAISLDGMKDSHNFLRNKDCFSKVIEKIKLVKKYQISLTIKTTVNKKNLNQIKQMHQLLKDLNIKDWHIFIFKPTGRGKQNADIALNNEEFLKLCDEIRILRDDKKIKIRYQENPDYKGFCYCGINNFVVLYNGDIIGCLSDERDNLKIQGNIKTDDIAKIWEEGFQSHRQKNHICKNKYKNYLNEKTHK